MLVVTDSEIATGNREVSDRGMFESRSLEGFLYRRVERP
jgi:hypothetical protein